ncbi:hypothetical protein BCR43DRAFT_488664 [Syncephalastrum racemosum]|uniref:Extracellular membrane protein CFEM domain-containing protein n=1 Tax=Syncephalastrum racemosum TaxID=13706 RepID=A0A1X2HJ83_SYNRA|nr:hypothetical protein BCR43DRAFT_488664 [Syncephalastrum racemosum]
MLRYLLLALVCFITVNAETFEELHQLFKRESGLPYDTLPNTTCATPAVCSNIQQPVTCRCSGMLTVCQNTNKQYCWGSTTLTQNSSCPAVPSECSSQFNGTANCLCNSQNVICVDSSNHYCFGNVGASSSVSLAQIPTSAILSASGDASNAASSNGSEQSAATSLQPMAAAALLALVAFAMSFA